jgi:hypothetical protein
MTSARPVLVVLGEPGVDPSFRLEDGVFSLRCYAPPESGRVGQAAPPALPRDVVRLDAATPDDALREARARAGAAPIVLAHAGERLVGEWSEPGHAAPPRGAVGRGGGGERVRLDLSIRVAGGETRHSPWFGGRRAEWAPAPGAARRAPAVRATRDPGDLSAILALLVRDALAAPLPRGRVGSARLLGGPFATALRVAFAGALRDGFRGCLVAGLHGLHRLIVLARAWQASGAAARGEAS